MLKTKAEFRSEILNLRNKLSEKYIKKASTVITDKFIKYFDLNSSKKIYLYNSFMSEVDTKKLINYSLDNNISLALPRVDDKDNSVMNFYEISDINLDTTIGNYGIFEPAKHTKIAKFEPDIIVIPGAVFDESLHRIGYGKGYYDLYLSKLKLSNVTLVAFAFDIQVLSKIPYESHDIKPSIIITESRIIKNDK